MAYVGDNGKRTAPKRASRPARKSKPPTSSAPHNVQTPPGGDIASSGGDYGTHAAKRYSASHAFKQSVRQTYAAQTPKQRQQVSRGARHTPGPAAAAIRHEHTTRVAANRRAAGTDTPRGNIPGFGQVQQQRRSEALVNRILQAHRDTPISSRGDTKSNLELATAQAYRATPQFQKDFAAGAIAGGDNSPGVAGLGIAAIPPPTGAAKVFEEALGKTIKTGFPAAAAAFGATANISSLARDYFGPNYKPGWENLPANFGKQVLDIPGQAVPSVTKGIIEPAFRGDVKTAASNAVGIPLYTAIAKHPLREIQEHPLSTGLAVAGPLKGASNILRAGAVRTGAIPPLRPAKVFPNTGLSTGPRPVARGIVGAVAQTIKDRPIRKGDQLPELMTEKDIRRAAAESQHSSEQRRRTEREVTAMTARSAIGKKVTPGHILGVQNYVRTVGDVRDYLGQIRGHQARDQAEHAKLVKSTPKRQRLEHQARIQARGKNIKAIENFLGSDEIKNLRNEAELPPKMQAQIEAYKAVGSEIQTKLGDLYGEQERVKMRGLLPYAQKRMGATHVKDGFVDNETGRLISKDERNALRKDLTAEEFDNRVQSVNNVWTHQDGKILTSKDIEAHQRLEGPKVAPEVAAEGELSIRQRELDQAEREARDFRSKAARAPSPVHATRIKDAEDNQHIAAQEFAREQHHVREGQALYRELKSQGKDTSPIEKRLADAAERLDRKKADLEAASDQLKKIRNNAKAATPEGVDLPASLYKKVEDARKRVEDLKGRIETEKANRPNTITPAAYISHAPNRKSVAAYFVSTNKAQKISPAGYTGKALDEGLMSLHKDVPIEDIVKSQGLVTAIEQYGKMVRDIAVRRDVIHPDAEGLVHDPAHPQVATFNTKQNAQRIADDWNASHPNEHAVAPFRISFTKGAQETILGDESDVMAGHRAENAMINAIKGEDTTDGGNWGLASDEFLSTSAKYLKENRPIARMIGSQFRRTVLALSIPWMVGNFGEATLRSALERSGPRSYYTGKHILNYLKENDPEAYHYLTGMATGGGHYGLRRSAGIYTGAEHLQSRNAGVLARRLGDAIMRLKTNPVTKHPAALVGGVWDAWTDLIFDRINGPIESQFQTAMMGKAFRENLMPTKLVKLSKKAMNDAIENKLDPRTMDMLGREVDRMYGKYSKFPPGLKRFVSHETPFIAWYINAVNFIYKTMPRNHPIVTSVINNADTATREWRKEKGLGMFLEHHVPAFLQGSVPTKSGNLRVARYTPFGLMGDPIGGVAGIFFPQAKTILLNLIGLDWKGDPIPGYEQNNLLGVTEAIKSIGAQLIPGYTIGNKALNAKEGEDPLHHLRRTLGDPFLKSVSPEQLKAVGGGGSSTDKYSISKPSSGGGSSDNKYKIGGTGGRPKKSSTDKYKIKP